ncbi:MAG: DUF885 domain-containing protein [Acidimicrobiia bacterium]
MDLDTLGRDCWDTYSEYSPTVATVRGEHGFDDQLRRFDDEWLDSMASRFRTIQRTAAETDTSTLGTQDRISYGLLEHESGVWATQIEQRFFVSAIDPYLGPHIRLISDSRQNTVATMEQADALLGRYGRIPEYLANAMQAHSTSASRGMTPAMASVTRVLSQLDGYLGSDLDDDPFLVLDLPDGPGSTTWLERATDLVRHTIRPAFEQYRDGLRQLIAPTARPDEKCGLVWMTNGEEIYSTLIHEYTQLEESPQRIHDIGQHWATQVNAAEWAEIGQRAFGLNSMSEVFHRLHTDPTLRFESEEEMLDHARQTIERAWLEVDNWFGARPDTPCNVVAVPPATAPAMPPAYYMQPPIDGSRPGTYFLNTYQPQKRDRFEYESIHFHEAVPGHHFDRSLASEIEGIPLPRRYARVYAHTEGWGLYSERLADEMGLYSSDVDRLGMVSADAWRAGRLVTDTGIHALGWSRQQAIEYLQRWTPIGLLTIEQEVDRYIGMAGQALSYKMGQLEILRLREEAERSLGAGFDIKGFHDTMLIHGAMPLPLLAEAVDDWKTSRA